MVPVITIDGPSGVGKGTIAKMLAKQLGWHFLDSGALYRLTALAAERQGVAFDNVEQLAEIARELEVIFHNDGRIELAGDIVTDDIRTETCGNNASKVAALQPVRDALLDRQRAFQKPPGLIADGRDMGTTVFPGAPAKVFLTASAEERARRRFLQLKEKGISVSIGDLSREIQARDERDTQRSVSPLRPSEDAITIDTSTLSIEQVFDKVMEIAQKAGIAGLE